MKVTTVYLVRVLPFWQFYGFVSEITATAAPIPGYEYDVFNNLSYLYVVSV
jgi:hypothetical protein